MASADGKYLTNQNIMKCSGDTGTGTRPPSAESSVNFVMLSMQRIAQISCENQIQTVLNAFW